jgi:hypothetical protein
MRIQSATLWPWSYVRVASARPLKNKAPATSVALTQTGAWFLLKEPREKLSTSNAPTSRSEAGRAGRVQAGWVLCAQRPVGSLEAALSTAQPNIHRRSSDHLGAVHVRECLRGVVRTLGYNACCRQRLGYVWPRSPTSGRKSHRCRCRNFMNPDVLI